MIETDERPLAPRAREGRAGGESAADAPFAFPDFETLLDAAAALVVGGATRDDVVAWFVAEAPVVAPLLGAALRDSPVGDLRAAFARRLWDTIPRPAHRFRADPVPAPARNDPCPCGSGRKYKQCCLTLDASLSLPPHLLLGPVLDTCPDEALDTLDGWALDADGLIEALMRWFETNRAERAVRLAAPMFSPERRPRGKLPRHAADVLEVLLDGWPPGFRDATFDELVERLGTHRDGSLAAIATEAIIRRRFDGGDAPGAWSRLRSATRRFPDDMAFVELEIDLLNAEGRFEESSTLAREWHARLTTLDPENAGFADTLLERAADIDPEIALEQACAEDSVLDRLVTLLYETPPGPIAGTHARPGTQLDPTARGELVLTPTPALHAVETRGAAVFGSPLEESEGEDPLTRLVSFLDDEPLALSSFGLLESLALTVDRLDAEPWADALLVRVLLRCERLLYRHVSREMGFETAEGLPDWQAMVWETAPRVRSTHPANRPALALLGALADWYQDTHEEGAPGDRLSTLVDALHGLDPQDDPRDDPRDDSRDDPRNDSRDGSIGPGDGER